MRAWSVGAVTPLPAPAHPDELSLLRAENQSLRSQVEMAYEWLLGDRRLDQQLKARQELEKKPGTELLQRRVASLRTRLKGEILSIPAQVIYRDLASWSSSLWVNVGEEDNRQLGKALIAKNSPVLASGSLVGVVDYVGARQSRIRLITDAGLSPAVRAARGAIQNREVASLVETLCQRLEERADLMASQDDKGRLISSLKALHGRLGLGWDESYLAKGELMGSSSPFWRSRGCLLKGVGFNFDYPDEEGKPPRSSPILKEGDFLVTSGLDGVFPAGLQVGTVTQVHPPHPGGYSYDIEVRPTAAHLNDLRTVFVLPPVSSD